MGAITANINRHESRASLLGGQSGDSRLPFSGGFHHREGYSTVTKERKNMLSLPNTPWSISFLVVTLVQAAIILAFESYVFAHFQLDLKNGATRTTQSRTIPTFLTLYIFGFIYQIALVYDALRLKNTIQVIGITLYNIGLLIYAAVQMEQIKDAVIALNNLNEIDLNVWYTTKPYLIAIPCILAFGTCCLAVIAWKLYDEFAWTIYKHISADLRMKRRYLTYQIYVALLKFDFFFFLGFTVQFVVVVTQRSDAEFALTIAAMPVTVVILLLAGFFTRRENKVGMCFIIFLYIGGLAYFLFKLVRMYQPSRKQTYLPARRSLTSFAVITILLIICTIINAILCMANFGKGLKPHVQRRKMETEEDVKSPMNEMAPNMPMPSRMTID